MGHPGAGSLSDNYQSPRRGFSPATPNCSWDAEPARISSFPCPAPVSHLSSPSPSVPPRFSPLYPQCPLIAPVPFPCPAHGSQCRPISPLFPLVPVPPAAGPVLSPAPLYRVLFQSPLQSRVPSAAPAPPSIQCRPQLQTPASPAPSSPPIRLRDCRLAPPPSVSVRAPRHAPDTSVGRPRACAVRRPHCQ